jgi:eukaryotic-like serine/threonine-protein kinase
MIGRTISHYRITEKLGEGGMGAVYKAEDVSLHRSVALKFLRPEAVGNAEMKARFLKEAEAAASLDHPNICTVYEIGHVEGQSFLAIAYVDGEDLSKQIKERPLPLDQALDFAIQIAEALRAAHRKGVVHRDIKPANIMIDRDGRAQIMDFGLAHLAGQTRITRTGDVMGTPAYMSPEQLRGDLADHRTDIWSFGVVLYEMLSGRLPFRSERAGGVAATILNEEPEPLTSLRTGVPLQADWIIGKVLANQADERYQQVDEILVDLRSLKRASTATSKNTTIIATKPAPHRRNYLPWVLFALMTVAAVASWLSTLTGSDSARSSMAKLAVPLPKSQSFAGVGFFGSIVALSPDGRTLAYVARDEAGDRLFVRNLDEFNSQPLDGTEGARSPFFSQDGEWIAFVAGGTLKKVSLAGGLPETISETEVACFGGDWGPGSDLFYAECDVGIKSVSADGGTAKLLTEVVPHPEEPGTKPEVEHYFPDFLPGSDALLFTVWNHPEFASIAVRSLETGEQRIIIDRGTYPRYVTTGHIVYAWDGDLLAVPFDEERLEVTGKPTTVVSGVLMEAWHGAAHFSIAENGTLAYLPGPILTYKSSPVWVDRSGNEELLPFTGDYLSPTVRRGSKEIVVSRQDNDVGSSLWVLDLDRRTERRLTDSNGLEYWKTLTPDGEWALFEAARGNGRFTGLFRIPIDASGPPEQLVGGKVFKEPGRFANDGKLLPFQRTRTSRSASVYDLWVTSLEQESGSEPFLQSDANEIHPAFSPNGKWMAYASDESGRFEVMVRPYPGPGAVTMVSSDGGWEPIWSPDGSELYYRNFSGSRVMAVSLSPGETQMKAGKPKLLFEGMFYLGMAWGWMYDLAPDGERFLMMRPRDTAAPPDEIRVVLNWHEELRRISPTD